MLRRVLAAAAVLAASLAAVAVAATPRARPALSVSCGAVDDVGPVWAPRGQTLAFARVARVGGGAGIYRIGADGKRLRLLSPSFEFAYEPAWSPDGASIAFSTFDDLARVGIVVARADGSNPRTVATFQDEREPPRTSLTWSPDGREVAFVGAGLLQAARIDGSGTRLIARGASQEGFSPDGRRIAYVTDDGLSLADASGGAARVLVANAALPAWSPDGTRLAYVSRSGRGVGVVRADGSGRRLVDATGTLPRWSPDGKRLVDFTQPQGRGRPQIHVVDVASARARTVSHDPSLRVGADDLDASFAPDGRTIAFTSTSLTGVPSFGSTELRLVETSGRGEHRLTYHCISAAFSGPAVVGTSLPDLILGSNAPNSISANGGDDTIRVRDGSRDTVRCGAGRDLVVADRRDSVARDCEQVIR